jgi:hypothetical protein
MDSQVGAILRQARNRRNIELPEVEAATRIRLRYLRAIESEDWEVLPGGVYTRGFIRTYAAFLGLDGERLAEDYRASVEGAQAATGVPEAATTATRRAGGPKPPRRLRFGWLFAAAGAALVAVAALVLLPGSDSGESPQTSGRRRAEDTPHPRPQAKGQTERSGVSVHLVAGAEVWVCLLDARERPLVDGQILEAGAEAGPFRSGSFTVSFGNGEVSMTVDGSKAEIPATSSPIGYSIGAGGSLSQLSETERPTCS